MAQFSIGGSPGDQDNLLSLVYDSAKKKSTRLTAAGLHRTIQDLSDSKEFRAVFGDAKFEKMQSFREAFSRLNKGAGPTNVEPRTSNPEP